MTRRASVYFCLALQAFFTLFFPAEALAQWHTLKLRTDGEPHTWVATKAAEGKSVTAKVYNKGGQARYTTRARETLARANEAQVVISVGYPDHRFRLLYWAARGTRTRVLYHY